MGSATDIVGAELTPPRGAISSRERQGHVVQFYSSDAFLLDVLSRFVGEAIATGDGAVVIATKAHHEGLEQRLEARGVNTAKAVIQGRYVQLEAEETLAQFMVNGSVSETLFIDLVAEVLGRVRKTVGESGRIAVFGELVALLWREGKAQEAIKVEQLWNDLARNHSFHLLCAYPIAGFDNEKHVEPFLQMCSQHFDVLPSEDGFGLRTDEERLRSIAHLQQKNCVLEKKLVSRANEAQFRLLVDAVQDYAIFMLDLKGNVNTWNPGAERIKGYKADEIIGKHFSCFYPQEDLRNGKPAWELAVATKVGRFEDEGWRLRKDGSRFWANVIIVPVKDLEGKLIGFGKVTRDFTERMKLERALQKEVAEKRQAEQRLLESERSLRELSLHLLSTQDEERRRIGRDLHDSLGQYLAALKMKLDSLASGRQDESDFQDCLRLMEDSVREVRTISYLLYPPMLEEMGLESAIRWYVDGFAARSGIVTTFEVLNDVGRLPREDELAMFRVLQESLANVLRHSESQSADVRLLKRADTVILEIRDKGIGIRPELLGRSGPDWTGALGVGLRGMKERMRQLGGAFDFVSTDEGTTVSAEIPVAASSSISHTDSHPHQP